MSEPIRSAKAAARGAALARRDAMDEASRIEASLALADHGAAHLGGLPGGTTVSGFLPIRSEVDIRPLMMELADRGARLCVPAIVEGELQFRELKRGAPLEPQGFGTYAPATDAAVLQPSVMLVPLAAFDRNGGRVGYGRGYYDRAIARIAASAGRPRLIGVAFACQEAAEGVPTEPHDERLDVILTETGIIEAASA